MKPLPSPSSQMPDIPAQAVQWQSQFESELQRRLGPEIGAPAKLVEAMRYSALAGGKRMRPLLVYASGQAVNLPSESLHAIACAVELIHSYSLIHDDLPAMDDDDLRRGKPTVHKVYDDATAILAGDALLTLAFDVMSAPDIHGNPEIRIALVRGLARAAGLGGMAGGQMLDLQAETARSLHDPAEIMVLQAMKTGSLIRFACEAGALLGSAGAEEYEQIKEAGAVLGMLFQISDDLLDAEGDSATLGKAAGKDQKRNKATLVAVLGIDEAKHMREEQFQLAQDRLANFGGKADVLQAALRFACDRRR